MLMSNYRFTLENFITMSNYVSSVLTESVLSPGEVRDVFYAAAEQIEPEFDEILSAIKRISKTSDIMNASSEDIKQVTKDRLDGIDYGDLPKDVVNKFEDEIKAFLEKESSRHTLSFLLSVIAATNAASKGNMNPYVLQAWIADVLQELRNMGGQKENHINLEFPLVETLPPLGFFTNLSSIAQHLTHMDATMDDDVRRAMKAAKKRKKEKKGSDYQILTTWGGKKKNINQTDFDSLLRSWEDIGRPSESSDIIKLLKKEGFTNNEIMRIFKKANVTLQKERMFNVRKKRNDSIAKLAQLTYKWGLEDLAINYIKDNHGTLLDSTDNDLVLENQVELTDSDLRKIFITVADIQTQKNQKYSPQQVIDKIEEWARDVKKTPAESEKQALVKEIANFLADLPTDDLWNNVVASVEKIIRSSRVDPKFADKAISNIRMGKIVERQNYVYITCFLLECGMSWDDLALQPTPISENKVRINHTIYGKNILIEDLLREIVVLQYIKNH